MVGKIKEEQLNKFSLHVSLVASAFLTHFFSCNFLFGKWGNGKGRKLFFFVLFKGGIKRRKYLLLFFLAPPGLLRLLHFERGGKQSISQFTSIEKFIPQILSIACGRVFVAAQAI